MTVPSTARRAGPFTGTGSLTSYPFTFKVFEKADLRVVVADTNGLETTLVLDSTVLITLNVDQDATPGGSVQYAVGGVATALPAGYSLAITGEGLEYEQTADLPQGGNFNPVVIENALDREMMLLQLLRDVVTRTLQLSVTTPAGVDVTLPTPVASNFIAWDDAALGLRNVDPNTLATIVAFASWQSETFDGTGVQTQFSLAADPGSIANTDVSVGGVAQRPNIDYTLSGLVITFTVAPYAGTDNILVRYGQALPEGTSTLQTRLASTASASDGAALVGVHDAAGLWAATTVEGVLAEVGAHNAQERTVESFGASTSANAATNTTAIQAAFDWLRDNGGRLKFKPRGIYTVNLGLTMLLTSSAQTLLAREIDFAGATLDSSASGATTGTALTIGGSSASFRTEVAPQVIRSLRLLGPEPVSGSSKADFSWMNTPTTTTRGLRLQYANKWSIYDSDAQLFYVGRETLSSWDDCYWQWQSRRCFIGEWRLDVCTVGSEVNTSFQYCAFCQVMKPSDTENASGGVRTYTSPRWEQSHVGAILDPGNTSGGGVATDVTLIGFAWHNMYIEAMTYDLFRLGIAFNTNPATRGSDQDKYIMNLDVSIFKLNHTFTSTAKMFVFPGAVKKVYGLRFYGPADDIADVVNPQNCLSKTWQKAHSKTNITNQDFKFVTSNYGMAVVDSDGTPPVILAQAGNIEALVDWPSALGGGGTLSNGTYEFSVREGYWNGNSLAGLFRYTISGSANSAVVQKDNSGATAALLAGTRIRVLVRDYAGNLTNAARLAFEVNGINGP